MSVDRVGSRGESSPPSWVLEDPRRGIEGVEGCETKK